MAIFCCSCIRTNTVNEGAPPTSSAAVSRQPSTLHVRTNSLESTSSKAAHNLEKLGLQQQDTPPSQRVSVSVVPMSTPQSQVVLKGQELTKGLEDALAEREVYKAISDKAIETAKGSDSEKTIKMASKTWDLVLEREVELCAKASQKFLRRHPTVSKIDTEQA